jgi:hypothetical protein
MNENAPKKHPGAQPEQSDQSTKSPKTGKQMPPAGGNRPNRAYEKEVEKEQSRLADLGLADEQEGTRRAGHPDAYETGKKPGTK